MACTCPRELYLRVTRASKAAQDNGAKDTTKAPAAAATGVAWFKGAKTKQKQQQPKKNGQKQKVGGRTRKLGKIQKAGGRTKKLKKVGKS